MSIIASNSSSQSAVDSKNKAAVRLDGIARHYRPGKKFCLRPFKENDECQLLELFNRNFPQKFTSELFRWKYFDNPSGTSVMLVAEKSDGSICGFQGAISIPKVFDGKEEIFHFAVDSIIDVPYRKSGLYGRMFYDLIERSYQSGAALFHGFPNSKALPNIKKRTGNYPLKLKAFARVVNWSSSAMKGVAYLLKRRSLHFLADDKAFQSETVEKGALCIKPIQVTDPSIQTLAKQAFASQTLTTNRTAKFLNWRYACHPNYKFQCFGLFDGGKLSAFLISAVIKVGAWRIGVVMDVVSLPTKQYLNLLLKHFVKQLKINKIDLAFSLFHGTPLVHQSFSQSGFYSSELNWCSRQFQLGTAYDHLLRYDAKAASKIDCFVNDPSSWYLGLGDTDFL